MSASIRVFTNNGQTVLNSYAEVIAAALNIL